MSQGRKRHYFILFSIFFVVCSPFLIFLSFGYDINLREQNISNTLTVKIDSYPKNSLIVAKGETKGTSPTELFSQDSQPFGISISHPGYLTDKFALLPDPVSNSAVDLKNLFLLPNEFSTFKQLNRGEATDYIALDFLNKDQVIIKSKDTYQIKDIGLGGFVNNSLPISEQEVFGIKFEEKIVLNQNVVDFLENNKKPWEKIGENVFYKDNYLLQKKSDYWLIQNISKSVPDPIIKIIRINLTSYLVLDNANSLWIWNGSTYRFIDNQITALSYTSTPDNIWLVRNKEVYRFQVSDFAKSNMMLDYTSAQYFSSDFVAATNSSFEVVPMFQGLGLLLGPNLVYIPDYDIKSYMLITNNAQSIFGENDSIFWLDQDRYPNHYNFFTKQRYIFDQIGEGYNKIFYTKDWNRLMIYGSDKVYSIWYNKDLSQKNILQYSEQVWISDANCYPKILEKVQYCTKEGDVMLYKNNLIF